MNKSRFLKSKRLKRDDQGRPLCRWCDGLVSPPRRTFCSDECVHEWRLRRQPQYVRGLLRQRDRGHCALCARDTLMLMHRVMLAMRSVHREERKLTAMRVLEGTGYRLEGDFHNEGFYWQADHKLAVADGGGSCGLDNFQTLCTPCHTEKTAAERRRRNSRGKEGE